MPQWNKKGFHERGKPYSLKNNELNRQNNGDKQQSSWQRMADARERKQQLFEMFNEHSKKITEKIKEYEQNINSFDKIVIKYKDKDVQESYRGTRNAMRKFAEKLENGNYPYINDNIVRQLNTKLMDAIRELSHVSAIRDAIRIQNRENSCNLKKMSECIEQITNNVPNDHEKVDLIDCKKQ